MKINMLLLFVAVPAIAGQLDNKFLNALNQVEASGRTVNVPPGDNGKAIGPFQIHHAYWQDSRVAGNYQQCTNYNYSVKVVNAYMNRYAKKAMQTHDYETLARIHNGGWNGANKTATKKYWLKVKRFL
jgi:hypothetical protein